MTGNEENDHTMAPDLEAFKQLYLMFIQNKSASSAAAGVKGYSKQLTHF